MQLADRMLTKLGLSAMDLLSEGELDAALRLKMVEWDRQMEAAEERGEESIEFDLASLLATKKPAGRSAVKKGGEESKTG